MRYATDILTELRNTGSRRLKASAEARESGDAQPGSPARSDILRCRPFRVALSTASHRALVRLLDLTKGLRVDHSYQPVEMTPVISLAEDKSVHWVLRLVGAGTVAVMAIQGINAAPSSDNTADERPELTITPPPAPPGDITINKQIYGALFKGSKFSEREIRAISAVCSSGYPAPAPEQSGQRVPAVLPPPATGVLGTVVAVGTALAINGTDRAIEASIKHYSTSWGAGPRPAEFWAEPMGKGTGPFSPTLSCFRLTKTTTKPLGDFATGDVTFDLIGQINVEDNQYMQIRPLGLFYGRPLVKTDERSPAVALTASVKIDGAWLDHGRGRAYALEAPFVSQKLTWLSPAKSPPPMLFMHPSLSENELPSFLDNPIEDVFTTWSSGNRYPLPPISIDIGGNVVTDPTPALRGDGQTAATKGTGPIEVAVQVNEVAMVPQILTAVDRLLSAEGRKASKGLSGAIIIAVGSGGGPSGFMAEYCRRGSAPMALSGDPHLSAAIASTISRRAPDSRREGPTFCPSGPAVNERSDD